MVCEVEVLDEVVLPGLAIAACAANCGRVCVEEYFIFLSDKV